MRCDWAKFDKAQQATIQAAFDELDESIWTYSEELFDDAMRCNVGEEPCELNRPYDLVKVPVSDEDLALVENAVKELSFPSWAELCDSACSEDWKATVGAVSACSAGRSQRDLLDWTSLAGSVACFRRPPARTGDTADGDATRT